MTLESVQVDLRERRDHAVQHAALSLLVPGAGQLAQHRVGAARVQFGTVAVYFGAALASGYHRSLLLALGWSVWSVIDAYRHEPD